MSDLATTPGEPRPADGAGSPLSPDGERPRPRWRTVARGLVTPLLVVVVFVGVLPRLADLSEVWAQMRAMTGTEVATLVAAATWNIVTYGFPLLVALPGLRQARAGVVTQASTAIANTVPGGAAVGIGVTYAMCTSWGFSRSAVARSVLVSGVWNTFAKLGIPLVALAVLALQGDARPALVTAALAGVGVLVASVTLFALVLRSDRLAHRIGDGAGTAVSRLRRALHRPPVGSWGDAAARFRAETVGLLQDRWRRLTAVTLVSHLSLYGVLLLSLRHVGVSEAEVSWAGVLGAFAIVRLVSALPITPGGLGVVELGLTAALVLAGGEREPVVAAVVVYRILTYALQIPVGAVCYAAWARWRRRRRQAPPSPGGQPPRVTPALEGTVP